MKTINLKKYYPYYKNDCFIEVPDQVAEYLHMSSNEESAYRLRTYRHKAYFSLDRCDGMENSIVEDFVSVENIVGKMLLHEQLLIAMNSFTPKQYRRLYKHYFIGMKKLILRKWKEYDIRK